MLNKYVFFVLVWYELYKFIFSGGLVLLFCLILGFLCDKVYRKKIMCGFKRWGDVYF